MRLKVNVENLESALALELIIKIYNLTFSEYIKAMILLDMMKITHRNLTNSDLLHGLEIIIMDHKTFKGSD
jgi:hypothetical protein